MTRLTRFGWIAFVLLTWLAPLPIAVAADHAPDFLREVRPILVDHCFACHGPDSGQRQSGLRLDQRDGSVARLESGKTAIQPGKATESELVRRIESTDPDTIMPPPDAKRPLNPEQQQLLRRWIDAGAPYSEHWAYLKPARPAIPPTRDPSWNHNPIDRFVAAKLDTIGLRPSPEAERITLIRRLSLDLTGLPPTIEEVDEFIADTTPSAYERLVDRLLASPHCGEKLAQDWLDLARFGDSSGYQDDGDRPNAPYRDYVIAAFNANMPFAQFTIENLAGDLLRDPTLSHKVASGFNRLHRHNEEGGSDPDEFQVVYTVDRTNTVATTWMGITFGCAQCHDHKYDPISQREYYQLYAFFNSLKGEVVISKSASPPQIRVPTANDQWRLDRLLAELTAAEKRSSELESLVTKEFDGWLKELKPAVAVNKPPPPAKTGAIGGVIARSSHTAWYADTGLESQLSLGETIVAHGRVSMVRSVNNIVDIGHFSTTKIQGGATRRAANLGLMAAEGPRYFACIVLPDGTRLLSAPIQGEHGVGYSWTYRYDPKGGVDDPADADSVGEGLLTVELQCSGKSVGTSTIDLTAAQRDQNPVFDAFGVSFRGATDADTPIEVFVDDVEYTSSHNGSRKQDFDRDPEWSGQENAANGHRFGFDPAATTMGPADLSVEQILALPADQRNAQHVARLRERFAKEKYPELQQLAKRITALRSERESIEESLPLALVWEELEQPRPARMLGRGDYRNPGDTIDRNVPGIFPPLAAEVPRDRLALARWLVSGDHPLTARVTVNRLWKQCFGTGLVRTPEDFGVRGEPPTHPELLDWLATEFCGNEATDQPNPSATSPQWDVKQLLRLIVTSTTYRQSSAVTPQLREMDPENRLLARGSRFRLTAEEVRDAALCAAGLLTRQLGGRSVYPYQPDHFYRDKEDDPGEWKWPLESGSQRYRRGLYTFIRRTTPYPPYQTFDAPSRGECTVARSRTNTPLQALVTMNDPVFVEAARVLGERIANHRGDDAQRLAFACRCVLSRPPSNREQAVLAAQSKSARERYLADSAAAAAIAGHGNSPHPAGVEAVEVAAWTSVAAVLLNLDEAITRE